MDGYILHPPAQDLATAGYSSAAKGGLAGVLVMLLLAIVFYVFFKCRNCSMKFEVDVEMQERSVHAAAAPGSWIVSLLSAMPWFGGYVGNWFNGYVGVGRAMAEMRWAVGLYGKEQDMGIAALEAMHMDMMDSTMEALEAMLMDDEFRVWSCSYGMLLELCCFGFLARSVLCPVGKGGEQGAVRSDQSEFWAFE
ncbi:hypothetical protein POTOM_042772 [Populus tomentosa]|uniref:Uncharacterized protein n=1 Tax=Populus tomentosa TaxID=118781 RepID=A0A8X8C8G3_POPTO|nr:hypothetical protein POTOM_042772 [Populus tomentosa]